MNSDVTLYGLGIASVPLLYLNIADISGWLILYTAHDVYSRLFIGFPLISLSYLPLYLKKKLMTIRAMTPISGIATAAPNAPLLAS